MRTRPKHIPRIESSATDRRIGAALTSYATLERIKKLLPRLLPDDLAMLRGEIQQRVGDRVPSDDIVADWKNDASSW